MRNLHSVSIFHIRLHWLPFNRTPAPFPHTHTNTHTVTVYEDNIIFCGNFQLDGGATLRPWHQRHTLALILNLSAAAFSEWISSRCFQPQPMAALLVSTHEFNHIGASPKLTMEHRKNRVTGRHTDTHKDLAHFCFELYVNIGTRLKL